MDGITASSSILLLICRETYAVLCLLPQNIHDPKQKKKLLVLVCALSEHPHMQSGWQPGRSAMHKQKWDAATTSAISTQPWVIRCPGSLNRDTIPAMVLSAG